MDNNDINNEQIFKELAGRYLEAQGKELLREAQTLPPAGDIDTARMDSDVHRGINAGRRGKLWITASVASGLAACLLLLILSGTIRSFLSGTNQMDTKQPSDGLGLNNTYVDVPFLPPDVILPVRMTVDTQERDKNQNIYRLSDSEGDNVVLTMEYSRQSIDTDGLIFVELEDGSGVYCRAEDRYYLLTFKQYDVIYTMTCRYEMRTVMELGEKILQQL